MVGESGTFLVGGVITGAVRRAVAEEEHAACLEFDRLGFGFIGETADVMIAVSIPFVRQQRLKRIGDDTHGAVGDGGIVNGDPHRSAA